MSRPIDEKLDQFKRQIQRSKEHSMTPKSKLNRNNSFNPNYESSRGKQFKGEAIELHDTGNRVSVDDSQVKLKMKKNPNFGGQQQQQQTAPAYMSSDDDIPVGFSRRKRLSSASSFQKKFEPQTYNNVNMTREEDAKKDKSRKSNTVYQEASADEINEDINKAKEDEEERIHKETEQILEQKREEIQKRLKDHEEALRIDKDRQSHYESNKRLETNEQTEGHHRSKRHKEHHHQSQKQQYQQQQQPVSQPHYDQRHYQMPPQMMYPPNFQQQPFPQYSQPHQLQHMQYPFQQYPPQNYFQQQMMPQNFSPQYPSIDISSYLEQNLKQLQDTFSKLQADNQTLKGELTQKQVVNEDIQLSLSQFDREKYQQHANKNMKLKQQLEDLKRKEIELNSRLGSLQANKQYLHGRANTLSMDIDIQDKQEDALNRQINDFNCLIREKETYIKQLMTELHQLKETKDQFQTELQVLSHKEEFMVNDLIFKEDQLNEILMGNEEMKRKIQSGTSQSKYLQAENERLIKELNQLKEENAVFSSSSDFLHNELLGSNENLNEYEHKLVMSQATVDQLQRQSQQDKLELAHFNATISNQQKAYDELKNQFQIINERNSRISMQNEMMMLRQSQQQEELIMQMNAAKRALAQKEIQSQKARANTYKDREYQDEELQESFHSNTINVQEFEQKSQDINRRIVNQNVEQNKSKVQKQGQTKKQDKQVSQKQKPVVTVNLDVFEPKRDGSPYQEIQRKSKVGTAMNNTLKWDQEEDPLYQIDLPQEHQKQINEQKDPQFKAQLRNQGQTMAGLLAWDEQQNDNIVTRYSMPLNVERKRFNLQSDQPPLRKGDNDDVPDQNENGSQERQRSRSQHRQDQMDEILKWEDENQRSKQSHENKKQIPNERLPSYERHIQNNSMHAVLTWDQEGSPFREREQMKEVECKQGRQQPIIQETNGNEGRMIRNKHYGQQMAGLLALDGQEHQQISPLRQNQQKQLQQPTQSEFNIDSGEKMKQSIGQSYNTPNKGGRAKQQQPTNKSSGAKSNGSANLSHDNSFSYKNYGAINEQIVQKQQSRKENLDKFLLQMQIEKEKLSSEVEKIGDHPRTTQQYRRKEEIQSELQILNSNIANTKHKLKQLKA